MDVARTIPFQKLLVPLARIAMATEGAGEDKHLAALEGALDRIDYIGTPEGYEFPDCNSISFAKHVKELTDGKDQPEIKKKLYATALAFAVAGSMPGSPWVALAKAVVDIDDNDLTQAAMNRMSQAAARGFEAEVPCQIARFGVNQARGCDGDTKQLIADTTMQEIAGLEPEWNIADVSLQKLLT